MPSLQSDFEMSKRRNRILRLAQIIDKNQGESKYKIRALYMLNFGVISVTKFDSSVSTRNSRPPRETMCALLSAS